MDPLIRAEGLSVRFRQRGSTQDVQAVRGVDLAIRPGEALGLVGESGSGKTTLGRALIRLIQPTGGRLYFHNTDVTRADARGLRHLRRATQMVFQDPYDSLNPRWRVQDAIAEPLVLQTAMTRPERLERVRELLRLVALDDSFMRRYPHELSGGQQQRIGIARALATNPSLVILDEPTSALDWLTRLEVIQLLDSLRSTLGLAYLFISHDLSAVSRVCDRILVMYLGKVVEQAPTAQLFDSPQHPYTRALLSAILEPRVDGRRRRFYLKGDLPSPVNPPSGCSLHPRCPISAERCAHTEQSLISIGGPYGSHALACMRITEEDDVEWPTDWSGPLSLDPHLHPTADPSCSKGS